MADSKKKAKKKVGHKRSVEDGKTKIEDIEEEVTESEGEEVPAEPAHVPPAPVKVRGTAVGGTTVMTAEEHDEYCKSGKLPGSDDADADEGE